MLITQINRLEKLITDNTQEIAWLKDRIDSLEHMLRVKGEYNENKGT